MPNQPVPRVAAMHDLSLFGRAALTVVIPILAAMGVQVCPLPTALFSTHGGFPGYVVSDLTVPLQAILAHWRALDLRFDAIYSGFLQAVPQVELFSTFIREQVSAAPLVLIDPVLGDHGKLYSVTDLSMVAAMRTYIRLAHVITPNLTEVALLLDIPYTPTPSPSEIKAWLRQLATLGPETVILTSAPVLDDAAQMAVVAYQHDADRFWRVTCERLPQQFPGTGDAFASVVLGSLLQGDNLPRAISRAVQFISAALQLTLASATPNREGLLLERALPFLAGSV